MFGVLTGLFVLFLAGAADYREAFDARETRIKTWLDSASRTLEETINARLHLVWGLDAFVKTNPEFTETQFLEFAGALELHWDGIRSLQLAPNGVVTYLTQPQSNEKARGLDLLKHPIGLAEIRRAIEQREYVIAGPFRLIQGSTAIVGRMPIFLPDPGSINGRFWGFASILLDVDALLHSAGIPGDHSEFELALRGRDGLGDLGDVFYGAPTIFDQPALRAHVALPTGSWVLAAKPTDFWPGYWDGRSRHWLGGTALAIAVGLLVFGLLRRPHQLKLAVRCATRALDASRQEYRTLAQVAPAGIYQCDADGNLTFTNEKFREITGLKMAEISGDNWDDSIHPDDLSHSSAEWFEAVKTGVSRCEYRYVHDDGTVIWVLDRATRTGVDDNGYATGFIGALADITDLKNAQVLLESARQSADAANRAKSEFLALISHEIRTPLNGIMGMVRVMLKGTPDQETRGRLALVEHSAEILLELLNDALDFSRIETKQLDILEEPFEMDEIIQDVAELWRPKAEEKGLRFVVDLEGCPSETRMGDAKRIRQVISNLISNAVKFTESGTVEIRAGEYAEPQARTHIQFVVSDTGPGISVDDQRLIFDKFTQADGSTSRRYDGSGLGLAICKQLVELMGGCIDVQSTPGQGATFSTVLPCPVAVAQRPIDTVSAEPEALHRLSTSLRILVAEDNPINQQVITAILDQPGIDLDIAENGLEAVEQVRTGRYDLVLMDVRMPELDGIGATQRIRALGGAAADVPIIAVTANTLDDDKAAYIAAGMNGCVTKPIIVSELLSLIAEYTGGDMDMIDDIAPSAAHHARWKAR